MAMSCPQMRSPVLGPVVPVWSWGAVVMSPPVKPQGVMSPRPQASHQADIPAGQLLAWELVELRGCVWAVGHLDTRCMKKKGYP